MRMNMPKGKELLALIRKGNYAHPGEEEAIDLILGHLEPEPRRRILDAGCGRGGTAFYIQRKDFGRVDGMDIDPVSIAYAIETYPELSFYCHDLCNASVMKNVTGLFDLVCMLTSLYAISDKNKALSELRQLAKPGTELVIFDYSTNDINPYKMPEREEGDPWFPVYLPGIDETLKNCGWEVVNIRDITEDFIRWYTDLVDRIKENKEEIIRFGSREWFSFMLAFYSGLLSSFQMKKLGGTLLRAVAR
jgi:SAM-dependent methyltransferase